MKTSPVIVETCRVFRAFTRFGRGTLAPAAGAGDLRPRHHFQERPASAAPRPIRVVGLALALLACWGSAPRAWAAASVEGVILGQVRDIESGQPVPGVTVVAGGPEGDVAAVTDERGNYRFAGLAIGSYRVRFYRDQVLAERTTLVGVDKTVRLNIRMPAVLSETETVAAPETPAIIDVGSSRIGTTFRSDFIANIPNQGDDVQSLMEKTPGAYNEQLGPPGAPNNPVGLSLSGGTGAENAYYLEGLNITAIGTGLLGTNLKSAFLEEVEVVSGGYGAEYGRALGGVVNMALKSGTNQWQGSAFTWVEPGWLAGSPQPILSRSTALTGYTQPGYTTQMGAELGGPIVKDKLFIWLGYVPETSSSNFVQSANRFVDDGTGQLSSNPDGSPVVQPLFSRMIPQESTTQNYAGKLTWRISPDHVLSLSLVGTRLDQEYMRGANMDPMTGMSHDITSQQDVVAHWQSDFFQRHFRLDASLGLHAESLSQHSPYGDQESTNNVTWLNTPSLAQFDPVVAPYCQTQADGFQPCPVQQYQSGGYGVMRETSAYRLAGQIRLTNVFTALGLHELRYGVDYEINQYNDQLWPSGVDGSRGQVYVFPDNSLGVYTLQRLPSGQTLGQIPDYTTLIQSPYYQDTILAQTRSYNSGLFVQESYMPLPNLTINAGLRWETQRMTDYNGNTALSIADAFAPRLGVIYDPTGAGRSKVFAHYGRYYESIPMDLAERMFGGEGSAFAFYPAGCSALGWRSCPVQGVEATAPGGSASVQPNIEGAYNNEVVLGGQYQVLRDWVVGASFIYRWLGEAIEDTGGSIADGTGATTLSNPTEPKPERTYKALQLTANKVFGKRWFLAGSYTYSRTMGNYTGLYSADNGQLQPNLTTQFDIPALMMNHYGPLPNDRPHVFHLDGYYKLEWGTGILSPGSASPVIQACRSPHWAGRPCWVKPKPSSCRAARRGAPPS